MKVSDKDGLLPIDSKTGIDQTGEFGNWYHSVCPIRTNVGVYLSVCSMFQSKSNTPRTQKRKKKKENRGTVISIRGHPLKVKIIWTTPKTRYSWSVPVNFLAHCTLQLSALPSILIFKNSFFSLYLLGVTLPLNLGIPSTHISKWKLFHVFMCLMRQS